MNLKNIFAVSVCGAMMVACAGNNATVKVEKGLKDAVGDKFLIGTALNGSREELIHRQLR